MTLVEAVDSSQECARRDPPYKVKALALSGPGSRRGCSAPAGAFHSTVKTMP
jgi:hypothetical protein